MSPWQDNILVQHPTQWRSFPRECRFLLHRLLKNGIKEINKLVCRGGGNGYHHNERGDLKEQFLLAQFNW